jgi:replicative DNA helicase
MADNNEIEHLIHTPAELATGLVSWAENIADTPGVGWGISRVDQQVIPMRPGNLVSIISRPGHGKTSLMARLARVEAERIRDHGTEDQIVIYITWEQAAEELEALFQTSDLITASDIAWGRVDVDVLRKQVADRARLPIWVIGYGVQGSTGKRMDLQTVLEGIECIKSKWNLSPTLLLFDYLQIIPVGHFSDRVQQVSEAPVQVKELALRIGAPAVCGVQARREVDDRDDKMPTMRDGQWAASIEQTSDKIFGVMRPVLYWSEGTSIKLRGDRYTKIEVHERMMVLRMLKQRFAKGRYTWLLYFNPELLHLDSLELEMTYK